ncbi:MAG: hypothetical protein U0Q03_23930 [Acidimicrobiales bacterium]
MTVEVASPWSGRQVPSTAAEEQAFVDELEVQCGDHDVDEFERRDVTVLLTALRCGLTPDELFAQAPGVKPWRILAAHRELEGRRLLAEHAWRTIAVDPTPLAMETFAPAAAELLPAVISQLVPVLHDEHRLRAAIEDAADQVSRTSRRVLMLERRLGEAADDVDSAREIGTLLYDVYGNGAWSLPTYLPARVGTLVPLRIGALLGDDITATRRAS